jgi:hypothetical protein
MSRGVMAVAVLISASYVNPTRGHVGDTTLMVELENLVEYHVDSSDPPAHIVMVSERRL